MQVSHISEAQPGDINDDCVVAGEHFVIVLDGATANGLPTGCVHDVPWVVSRLAARLAARLIADDGAPLTDILADGIAGLRELHAETCDLTHPNSPSTTVALLRVRAETLDYLVLCDSPVVIETTGGEVHVINDDALANLPGYTPEIIRDMRNQPGGFWVASTDPEAAKHALTGSLPVDDVHRAAVMTDGMSRLVDRYDWQWRGLLDHVEKRGPVAAVQAVRAAELQTPAGTYRGKRHDDATIALCTQFGR
ncbi:protein phosphatase 2C domain-containing protein [Embleya sp. NBC_00896]|uniref:protein phosphatase 2C domain-containing protein n=1 Tax=Embleya sp. NBC_00896 TaxID=2975961 RepID=UPI003867403C|nr:protein phosphatase 2C domain-containing protein [Embleya sp. NBC_00896]